MEHTAPDLIYVSTSPPESLPGFLALHWYAGQPLRTWLDGRDPFPDLAPETSIDPPDDPGRLLARRFVAQGSARSPRPTEKPTRPSTAPSSFSAIVDGEGYGVLVSLGAALTRGQVDWAFRLCTRQAPGSRWSSQA